MRAKGVNKSTLELYSVLHAAYIYREIICHDDDITSQRDTDCDGQASTLGFLLMLELNSN